MPSKQDENVAEFIEKLAQAQNETIPTSERLGGSSSKQQQ
jgi:hypothetical protein